MQLRGARRRRNVDRGFVLSDHADWPGLLEAIAATGAPRVIVTHGYVEPLVRYLREQGLEAGAFKTEYGDDEERRKAVEAEEPCGRDGGRRAMKDFAALFAALDATTSTKKKTDALLRLLPPRAARPTPPGRCTSWPAASRARPCPPRLVRAAARECAGIPEWLFDESYDVVGDLAETVAHVLPPPRAARRAAAARVGRGAPAGAARPGARGDLRARCKRYWDELDTPGRFLLDQADRRQLPRRRRAQPGRARAGRGHRPRRQAAGAAPDGLHRQAPRARRRALRAAARPRAPARRRESGQPYPFFLAHPLQAPVETLGDRADWQVEWKWDGIRAQLIRRGAESWLWSRGEDLLNGRFPELDAHARAAARRAPCSTARSWSGATAACSRSPSCRSASAARRHEEDPRRPARRLPRLRPAGGRGRRRPRVAAVATPRAARAGGAPAPGRPRCRSRRWWTRRDWPALAALRDESRARGVEGFMLKQREGRYGAGRTKDVGTWWKWKIDPYTVDAVLIYAQSGHGRRASLYTDYTFAVWDGEAGDDGQPAPPGAVRQGLLGPHRRRDAPGRPAHPPDHHREVRPGAQRHADAGLRARLRRHPGVAAPQVRHRGALSAHAAAALGQAVDEADSLATLREFIAEAHALRQLRLMPGQAACPARPSQRWLAGARLEAVRVPARGVGARWRRAAAGCCTPTPAPARRWPRGSARCRRWQRRDAARARTRQAARAAADGAVDHADARARRRHRARAARPAGRPRARWTLGLRTGDTPSAERARAGQAAAHRAGHHAGEPDAAAGARRRAATRWRTCSWWWSTNGTSCWATSAACRCSWRWRGCGDGDPALMCLGAVGHARQPRRGAGRAGGRRRAAPARRARGACAATSPKTHRHRHRCCPSAPSASRGAATWACACCRRWSQAHRGERHDAGLHQHALAGGALVPGAAGGAARLGRRRSRCTTARSSREVREWVEPGLKAGTLRAVVCTSSLDLGVDFLPVDRVLQIGSAKGVARLLQRAGRSGHAPGRPSRVTLVPTHSLELVEAAAARHAAQARPGRAAPVAARAARRAGAAPGDRSRSAAASCPTTLLAEVRTHGAPTATSTTPTGSGAWTSCARAARRWPSYPDYQRVAPDDDGVWRVPDARLARRHRVNIGTIVSDASIDVQYLQGGRARAAWRRASSRA